MKNVFYDFIFDVRGVLYLPGDSEMVCYELRVIPQQKWMLIKFEFRPELETFVKVMYVPKWKSAGLRTQKPGKKSGLCGIFRYEYIKQ